MKIYTVKTTTFNLAIAYVSVMGMIFLIALVPDFYKYLRAIDKSETFIEWAMGAFVFTLFFVVIGWEYLRNMRYLDVEVTDEGIRTNWFVSGGSWISRNLLWTSRYTRAQRQIRWEEIERTEFGDIMGSNMHGVRIRVNNEKQYYWFCCLYFLKKPKVYKELISEIEARYEANKKLQP